MCVPDQKLQGTVSIKFIKSEESEWVIMYPVILQYLSTVRLDKDLNMFLE